MSILPSPGYEKTDSTTTTPPIRYVRFSAVTFSAGPTAFGSACRTTTRQRGTPLSVAILTYSESSTSIRLSRSIRIA